MIKLLHTGDIHANKTRAEDVCKLIDFYISEVDKKSIDAVLICGDFWDCAVVNNKEFASIIGKMAILIAKVPVYMIYGTASHEINASLEVFAQMGAHVTYEPHLWTFTKDKESIDILGVPEPRRSDFIANTVEETNEKINAHLMKAFNIKHDNPLIIMHHNEMSGATMQNGVASKCDTQLTKKMYEQCNPIYIAMAHIHQPQIVDKIARYSGSPIPCTFGELHQAKYELLSIENGTVSVESIPTPFPTNRVIECNLDTFRKMDKLNFKDTNVKVKLSLSPDQRKLFKVKDEAKKLKEATNAHNVLITISTTKEVSVRSKEIAKTTSIQDKLKIYADINKIKLTQSILQKAKDIEDSMLIKYTMPSHSFELLSLSLKGAKGLQGREEINIDFSKYEDGVIALLGQNGSGKSTILENCSPYPCLLTRSGALRSHFYLKDSHRIVIYRDETNKYYRFTIQLAAHIDSGLVKYLVDTSDDEGKTWSPVKECDGNLDTYKTYVEGILGSLPMYLRTAFFTKGKVKGVNDIATATKGERIELLSELLGTDALSNMHDMIKDNLKEISKEMDKFENIEEQKSECQSNLTKRQIEEKRLQSELNLIQSAIDCDEQTIKDTRKAKEEYDKNYAKFGNAIQMKSECEDRYNELAIHLEKLKAHKVQNDFYKSHEKQIVEYKETYIASKPLQEKYNALTKKLSNASATLLFTSEVYNSSKEKYNIELNKYNSVDDRIKDAQENMIEESDFCPTCGAKLSEKKKKQLAKANEYIQNEIDALKEFKENQKEIVNSAKKTLNVDKNAYDKAKTEESNLRTELDTLNEQFQATRAYLDMNSEYEEYINYTVVNNLETDIDRVSKDINDISRLLESLSGVDFIDYEEKLNELEESLKDKQNDLLHTSMDLATVQNQIEQLQETLEEMSIQEKNMKELAREYEEYSILEQAFSNGGIMALELEAAAPEIAELTNSILHECYGDKFTISFTTLKQSRNKIIDDFSIDVTNNESGWTTPIELLSEGEKIWCINALYFAFSLLRMQRTGFSFVVRFIDESDGALDSESRLKYLKMIESVHKSGTGRLTLLITHSQEIKDLVSQTIQL